MKKYLPAIFLTILAIILIGIKFYPYISSYIYSLKENDHVASEASETNEANDEVSNNNQPADNGDSSVSETKHRSTDKEEEFPFVFEYQRKNAENHPDQFAIVEKMYYGLDYINNAQGIYKWGHDRLENTYQQTEFTTDFETMQNINKDQIFVDGELKDTTYFLFSDGQLTYQSLAQNSYYQETVKENPRGLNVDTLISDALFLGIRNLAESEWYVLIYDNYDDWDYTVSTKFGIPAFQINGVIDSEISESLAGPFEMTVAKDTRTLLDLKCFGDNQKENPIFFIEVESISINEGIQDRENVFTLDLSNSKKVSQEEYREQLRGDTSSEEKTGWDA
jgi:hypothetical protein